MEDSEDELLIYNFQTTKIPNDWFEQIYFFEKGDLQRRLGRMNARLAQKSDI